MEEAQLKAGKKRKNEEKHKKPVSAELVIEFEEVDCLYLVRAQVVNGTNKKSVNIHTIHMTIFLKIVNHFCIF